MFPPRLIRSTAAVLLVLSVAESGHAANTATITGRVLYKDGTPAKGVPIKVIKPSSAQQKTPIDNQGDDKDVIAKATTDDNGQYTCKDVPPGFYRVIAGSLIAGMAASSSRVDEGATVTLNFSIKPPHKPD